jgi:hypothetical protein
VRGPAASTFVTGGGVVAFAPEPTGVAGASGVSVVPGSTGAEAASAACRACVTRWSSDIALDLPETR